MMTESQKMELILGKIDTLQEDMSYIRSHIVLVEKHEKILYGNPEHASDGKCGLINQVAGQGRKLDSIQNYITRAGTLVNIIVTAVVSSVIGFLFRKSA